jgi:hypothetical protein
MEDLYSPAAVPATLLSITHPASLSSWPRPGCGPRNPSPACCAAARPRSAPAIDGEHPQGASAARQTWRGGPRVRPPGSRPSPAPDSVTLRRLRPALSMTRRWPRTGSAPFPDSPNTLLPAYVDGLGHSAGQALLGAALRVQWYTRPGRSACAQIECRLVVKGFRAPAGAGLHQDVDEIGGLEIRQLQVLQPGPAPGLPWCR